MKKILLLLLATLLILLPFTSCDESKRENSEYMSEVSITDFSTPEDSVPEESTPEENSAPEASAPEASIPDVDVPEESVIEESTAVEKYVWYGETELKAWFAELKQSADEYEPREQISSDGMRLNNFTNIPGPFIEFLEKNWGKVFDTDYVPKFGACGDTNIAAIVEYYGISKEEYIEFCKEYLKEWGKAPYGEKPIGLEIYMLNWDAWFSEEYWNHPDFVFSDYNGERYDCYYTSLPDRGDYTRRYYRIDYALIQYVGEERFQQWLDEKEDVDQNILDFIEYFEITREQYDKLYKDYFPIPYNADYLFGTPEMQDEYFKVHPLD